MKNICPFISETKYWHCISRLMKWKIKIALTALFIIREREKRINWYSRSINKIKIFSHVAKLDSVQIVVRKGTITTRKGHKFFANVTRRYLIHLISRWKIVPPPTLVSLIALLFLIRVCALFLDDLQGLIDAVTYDDVSRFPSTHEFRIEFLYGEPYTIYSSLLRDICCSMCFNISNYSKFELHFFIYVGIYI